jgi:hypothetical protein
MREQRANSWKRRLAGAAPAAVLALSLSLIGAQAGDPIQFSGDKGKPAPGAETRPADTDVFKTWNKSKTPAGARLNALTPFIVPADPMDPKDERRLKNARDERKNWMLLEPGELQKREEEDQNQFGGRSVAIDNFESDDTDNYLFYNVTEENKPRNNNPGRDNNSDSDDPPRKDHRTLSLFPREMEKPGAHTASELNLKGLIDPAHANGAHFNKNEASLFQFLKDNAPPATDRDQQARRDSFRTFINGGPANTPAPSGMSDPINFRTDLTQERMNPIMPNRPAFDLPAAASKAPDSFLSRPPAGSTPGRADAWPEMATIAPRQPMGGPHVPSPLWIQNEPKAPKASVMGSGSLFNRDAPRRGGL